MIGIGTNIFLRHAISFDADAQIYFDAVIANGGVLSTDEKNAYNVYRIDAKNNTDTWESPVHVNYPMLGGTAESCAINAHNPGTFDTTFINTVSGDFTSNGWTSNGTDSYGRTGLIPSTTLTLGDLFLQYYSRINTNACEDISARDSSASSIRFGVRIANQLKIFAFKDADVLVAIGLGGLGSFSANIVSTSDVKLYKNGVEVASAGSATGILPTREFYIGARNGAGTAVDFSNKECAGLIIADKFTTGQITAEYNAIQIMNTKLSRNV